MKAQTFKIMGSQSLLEAMWKELLSIGYTEYSYTPKNTIYSPNTYICTNTPENIPDNEPIKAFKNLFYGNLGGIKMNKHFNLPEQYNEALEFAKEQLEPKYWNTRFNFEVGKWYYFEAYKSKSKTFAKCKKVDDIGFDSTDWIVCDTFYAVGRWCYEDMHNIREATLEEIQNYLPDGHPYKKYIPKKGDYIYHNNGNYGWITIFSEFRNGKIIGEHSLPSNGSKNFYLTYRNSNDDSELRLATPEEKQWLDACIKAGKFISKEEALETEEERLIKEAKKRYPVGTKFYPAHVNHAKREGQYCIITNDNFKKRSISIVAMTNEGDSYSSTPIYGNTLSNRNVYYDGKWAEIVPEVKKWDVGTYVVFLKKYGRSEPGDIDKIVESSLGVGGMACLCEKELITTKNEEYVKWFATKEEAEEFAKILTSILELPFGKTMWTIHKDLRLVTSAHGQITFDEILSLHTKIEILQSVELLGHTCIIPTIKFGCQEGTIEQFETIYSAVVKSI